ncbi:GFA family protein [Bartonella sp. HY761]|uniref:GFA family protein n=1 Tax=Bartonella sp. HY761 TaxID=2979330 RepID=UPI00220461F1|nr:GFA family protein [Bartonella sp. HY761]UXN05389.1 GFA family protein [Bartonella sp. HY761]
MNLGQPEESTFIREGKCLCGDVHFKAKLSGMDVGICHCHMCQKMSGGVFMSLAVDPAIEVLGNVEFSVYPSSSWGERLFCSSCGSSLGWRMRDGSMVYLSAAAFDDQSGFELKSEIYYDEKPHFYEFANETRKMTGKDIEALFSNGGI